MNTQSNASRSRVESVAFMAAFASLLSAERQIKFIDDVLDIIDSPSLSSLGRMVQLRNLLMKHQELVTFIHDPKAVLLEPSSVKAFSPVKKSSSNQPKLKKKRIKYSKFGKQLEYYVLEICKQNCDN